MEILISNASGLPIYEQITTQIKQKILSGELAAGEALPSIRALAKDLRISVITTKRAYDELEREGLVCTVAGKGCFVAAAQPGMDSGRAAAADRDAFGKGCRIGGAGGCERRGALRDAPRASGGE